MVLTVHVLISISCIAVGLQEPAECDEEAPHAGEGDRHRERCVHFGSRTRHPHGRWTRHFHHNQKRCQEGNVPAATRLIYCFPGFAVSVISRTLFQFTVTVRLL